MSLFFFSIFSLLLLLSLPPLISWTHFSLVLSCFPFLLCPNRCRMQLAAKWPANGNSMRTCPMLCVPISFSFSSQFLAPFLFSSFPSRKWLTQIWKWHPSAAWTSSTVCANYRLPTLATPSTGRLSSSFLLIRGSCSWCLSPRRLRRRRPSPFTSWRDKNGKTDSLPASGSL